MNIYAFNEIKSYSLRKSPIKLQETKRFIGMAPINHRKRGIFIGAGTGLLGQIKGES